MADFSTVSTLPRLPALETDGSNWPIFAARFTLHITGLGYSDHLEEENYPKKHSDEPKIGGFKVESEYTQKHNAWKEEVKKWKASNKLWLQDDAKAKAHLAEYIPASIFLETHSESTFYEMWNHIRTRFQATVRKQKRDLRWQLNDMSMQENGDVKAHLTKLEGIIQTFASRGITLPDDKYCDAILQSLPQSCLVGVDTFETTLAVSNITLTSTMLKDHLIRTYEITKTSNRSRSGDIGLGASSSKHGGGKGRRKRENGNCEEKEIDPMKWTCFNCGGKGHRSPDCTSPKIPKEKKNEEV
jgi:hypothetical protein